MFENNVQSFAWLSRPVASIFGGSKVRSVDWYIACHYLSMKPQGPFVITKPRPLVQNQDLEIFIYNNVSEINLLSSFTYCHWLLCFCPVPQRNVAGSSSAMEYLGFQRCFAYLSDCGIKISTFISDRHTSIAKHMREKLKEVVHYFDLWHLKKVCSYLLQLVNLFMDPTMCQPLVVLENYQYNCM